MTKVIAIIILFACTLSLQAQTNNIDEKLLKKYSKKELTILKKEKPDDYKLAKYCVNNAFYIAATSKEKIATNPENYGEITIKDLSNINFFELNIDLKQNDHQTFIIKGTSKILIVKSKDHILRELKKK